MRYLFIVFLFTAQIGYSQSSSRLQEAKDAFESGKFDQAQSLFDGLYASSKDAEHAYYLGRIAIQKGEYADAIKLLEEAVKKNGELADYHYWLSESYFKRIDQVGAMKKLGLAKKGKKAAERSIELNPGHEDARTSLVYFYTQAPSMAGGSKDKALDQANILRTYNSLRGGMLAAMVYSSQEKFDKADAEYEALLTEYAQDADVHYASGMYYQRQQRYEKAIQLFEKAVEIDSAHLNSLYQVGRSVVFADNWHDTGIMALKKYVTMELPEGVPSHASAWWRLGMIHELAGNPEEARTAFESALEVEPDHKEAKKALKELNS